MTPLHIVLQRINNTPYTTPTKRGPEIDSVAYCRNVISGRGLFRLVLNVPTQILE